ncbi:hypothetical protein CDD83_2752 [Cordyceps sp. RAO-2017]|nr:hypothetical protein CDD83_2752 [Cordyceps sp. RAO-2017]
MAWAWQHWLSPRPSTRTATPSEPRILTAHDAALFEFLHGDDGRWFVRETHYIDNAVVRAGRSGPPLHIHLQQTEYFEVEQGVIGIVKNGQELALTKEDGVIEVPPGTRHRFWAHPSGREDLIFRVWTEPQGLDHGFDEDFLRNLVAYQRDCLKAGIAPSVFQLLLIGYNSTTLATPPFWLPLWLLKAVHYVLACWVAGALLGYKGSYPEYTNHARGSHSGNTKKSL